MVDEFLSKKDWDKAYEDLSIFGNSGRNLLSGTDFNSKIYKYEHINKSGEGGLRFGLPEMSIVEGYEYTLSLSMRGYSSLRGIVLYRISPAGNNALTFANPEDLSETEFKRFEFTFVSHRPYLTNLYIYTGWSKDPYTAWFEIEPHTLKVEKGSKASIWTPSFEESDMHPFVADLAETSYKNKVNREEINELSSAITALGGSI